MKSNKAYLKRIRVTRTGKLVARVKGQNHFNAKSSGSKRLAKRRAVALTLTARVRRRFLAGTGAK
ncbi:MAG: 50S ribosomal protein L35 [Patescibacteria group bacterium]|nr:50S ribosomal protein L35 [Patescibacteria group bacterium]MDE1944989.1 50S ribosomal protein L35 [Patescibacteria group bacterium]MDE2057469.1 50S ribosomal protein L35 [Patescibacteria group bacterium]